MFDIFSQKKEESTKSVSLNSSNVALNDSTSKNSSVLAVNSSKDESISNLDPPNTLPELAKDLYETQTVSSKGSAVREEIDNSYVNNKPIDESLKNDSATLKNKIINSASANTKIIDSKQDSSKNLEPSRDSIPELDLNLLKQFKNAFNNSGSSLDLNNSPGKASENMSGLNNNVNNFNSFAQSQNHNYVPNINSNSLANTCGNSCCLHSCNCCRPCGCNNCCNNASWNGYPNPIDRGIVYPQVYPSGNFSTMSLSNMFYPSLFASNLDNSLFNFEYMNSKHTGVTNSSFFRDLELMISRANLSNPLERKELEKFMSQDFIEKMQNYSSENVSKFMSSNEINYELHKTLNELKNLEYMWNALKQKSNLLSNNTAQLESAIKESSLRLKKLISMNAENSFVVSNPIQKEVSFSSDTSKDYFLNNSSNNSSFVESNVSTMKNDALSFNNFDAINFKNVLLASNIDILAPDSSKFFYLKNGSVFKSIRELIYEIPFMSDDVFEYHVNFSKNDFADWIEGVFNNSGLAESVRRITNKRDFIRII